MEIIKGLLLLNAFVFLMLTNISIKYKDGLSVKIDGWLPALLIIVIITASIGLYAVGQIDGRKSATKIENKITKQ